MGRTADYRASVDGNKIGSWEGQGTYQRNSRFCLGKLHSGTLNDAPCFSHRLLKIYHVMMTPQGW